MPPITLNWWEFGDILTFDQLISVPRYDGLKVVAYFCLGYVAEAAERGFFVYETKNVHPKCVLSTTAECMVNLTQCSHRHTRYILFFHCLALIECVRKGRLAPDVREKYMDQVEKNAIYIKKYVLLSNPKLKLKIPSRWLSPSPVNNSAWIALIVRCSTQGPC